MRAGRDQTLRERARRVAVALDVLLGRVDLDEPDALAADELDRVAVDHAGDDGVLLRVPAREEGERGEREHAQRR